MNTLLLILIASLCGLSRALAIPVAARDARLTRSNAEPGVRSHAMKLVGIYNGAQVQDATDQDVANFQDTVYATNLTIGGQEILIQLDTGSSDLWINLESGQIDFTNLTNIEATQTYGIGSVTGPIAFANVSMGPHVVSGQAFINATNATDFGTIFGDNVRGILGLSFDAGSVVDLEIVEAFGINASTGRSFMTNLFLQNDSMPHFFTVQLGRSGDPNYVSEGIFTIGEYDPELSSIADQPQLPRFPNSNSANTPPRWSTVMDGMTVNGQSFTFNTSGVPGTPEGSVVAVLDTGFTFPPLPEPAVTFIYGSIEGAYFDNSSSLWIVPCENSTTLEFQFGGVSIPIHPLDITTVTELNNQTVCVNTFRPTTFPVNPQFDIILGDAFLKNVYASFDYGNFSVANPDAIPFIQLLPTTNITAAFDEFAQVRSSMFAAAEASASVSATSVVPAATPSTVDCGGAPAVSPIPTSSMFFASAWSSSPASAVLSSYAPVATASLNSSPTDVSNTTAAATDGSSTPVPTASVSDNSSTVPSSNTPCPCNSTATGPMVSASDPPTDQPTTPPTDPSADPSASPFTGSSTGSSTNSSSGPSLDLSTGGSTDLASPPTDSSKFLRRRSMLLEPSRTVTDCLAPLVEQYGAVLFALLGGSLIVSMVLCVVTIVLALRNHARSQARRRAAYSVLEAKVEADADPEADILSAKYYYDDGY